MVKAGFIALLVDNLALLLAGSVDYHTWCVDKQLDSLVCLGVVGVVMCFANGGLSRDFFLKGLDYEFAYVFVLSLADVDITLATL